MKYIRKSISIFAVLALFLFFHLVMSAPVLFMNQKQKKQSLPV